eukprot:6396054-Prymnesium_polylepis.1
MPDRHGAWAFDWPRMGVHRGRRRSETCRPRRAPGPPCGSGTPRVPPERERHEAESGKIKLSDLIQLFPAEHCINVHTWAPWLQ